MIVCACLLIFASTVVSEDQVAHTGVSSFQLFLTSAVAILAVATTMKLRKDPTREPPPRTLVIAAAAFILLLVLAVVSLPLAKHWVSAQYGTPSAVVPVPLSYLVNPLITAVLSARHPGRQPGSPFPTVRDPLVVRIRRCRDDPHRRVVERQQRGVVWSLGHPPRRRRRAAHRSPAGAGDLCGSGDRGASKGSLGAVLGGVRDLDHGDRGPDRRHHSRPVHGFVHPAFDH